MSTTIDQAVAEQSRQLSFLAKSALFAGPEKLS